MKVLIKTLFFVVAIAFLVVSAWYLGKIGLGRIAGWYGVFYGLLMAFLYLELDSWLCFIFWKPGPVYGGNLEMIERPTACGTKEEFGD